MHIHKKDLRAYVDGQLPAPAQVSINAHLQDCAACRALLADLQSEVALLDERLQQLAPPPQDRPQAGRALARVQAHVGQTRRTLIGGTMFKNSGLSRNWQRAFSGLAAVVVIGVLLAFAPVRAAASELLAVFRVEEIVLLPVSVSQIEDLQAVADELGEDFFPGSSETLVEPGEPQQVDSLDEAAELAGFDPRRPSSLPPASEIAVQGEMVTRFVPDVAQMQLLFEAAGLDADLVPAEIDGQSFDFDVPPSVMQAWNDNDGADLILAQMPSPSISFPDEVDEEALGLAMLQLFGYSPDEAAALSASIDWTTTLVMPVPANQASFEEVAVDGGNGFLMSEAEGDGRVLLWQKNGIVYFLGGIQDDDILLDIANSLQ